MILSAMGENEQGEAAAAAAAAAHVINQLETPHPSPNGEVGDSTDSSPEGSTDVSGIMWKSREVEQTCQEDV